MNTLYQKPYKSSSKGSLCEAPALSSLCRYVGFEPAERWLFSTDSTETLECIEVDQTLRCITKSMFPGRPGPLSMDTMVQWHKDFLFAPTGRIQSCEGNFVIGSILGDATSGIFGIGKFETIVRFAIHEERGDALFFTWSKDGDVGKDNEKDRGKNPNSDGERDNYRTECTATSHSPESATCDTPELSGMNNGHLNGVRSEPDEGWRYLIVTYMSLVDLCHRQRDMILFDLKEWGGVHSARAKQRIATIEVRDCPLCHSTPGVCFCSKLKNVVLPRRTYCENNVKIRDIQKPGVTTQHLRAKGGEPQLSFASTGLLKLYAVTSGVYRGDLQMFEFDETKSGQMIRSCTIHIGFSGEVRNDDSEFKRKLVSDFVQENCSPTRDVGLGHHMIQSMMQVVSERSIEEERKKFGSSNKTDITYLLNQRGVADDIYDPTRRSPIRITEVQNSLLSPAPLGEPGPSTWSRKLQPRSDGVERPVLDRITKEKLRVLRNRERAQISNEKRRARLKSMELQLSNSKATVNLLLEMTIALQKENDRLKHHIQDQGLTPINTHGSFDPAAESGDRSETPAGQACSR